MRDRKGKNMYKKDYHPDADLIFKTKNYGFDSPKSVPLEPLSNALVQIDSALKAEEIARVAEDERIDERVNVEIADRKSADESILNVALRKSDYNVIVDFSKSTQIKTEYPVYQIGKYFYAFAFFLQSKTEEGTFTIRIPKNAKDIWGLNTISFADSEKNIKLFSWIRDEEKDDANYIAYTTENISPVNVSPVACTTQLIWFTI